MNKDKQKLVEEYNENSIATLDDRIAVRTRSSMYIGDVGINGVTVCLREIFDNAVDEFSMGVGDTIDVKIYNGKEKDKRPYAWMEVTDRGRGIPVGPSKEKYKDRDEYKSTLTLVLTTLHSGGKFTTFNNHGYSGSQSGLHGVGASCVNFLSRKFVVMVRRNGGVYSQVFEYGIEKTPVTKIGECSLDDTGTTIGFLLDDTIFKSTIVPSDAQLISLFDETTALNKNLKVNYENQITGTNQVFYHPEGIKSYMNKLCDEKTKLFEEPFYIDTEEKVEDTNIKVEIAFMFDNPDKTHETFRCFANNVANQNGGFHLNGFRDGLKEVINDYAIKAGLIKEELELKYITENISAIISVKGNNFAYEGQTKGKLATIEAKTAVINSIRKAFKEFVKTRKEELELIVNKAIKTKAVEEAARKARSEARALQKVSNQRSKLPGKLCECTNKIGSYRELIVVEGDSAGGCWTADTLIRLVDNRILTIKEVIEEHEQGEVNYVFGCTKDGTIKIEPILDGFLTKKDARIVRLTLDNGKQIRCTPDHRIMLRDGSYKEAQYLTEDDSLMSDIQNTISEFNRRIVKVEQLEEKEDVYDITVKETHNFLLEAGIFVHNCVKLGRIPEIQSVLPLRGKILNVEKSELNRILGSETIQNIVTCLGCGIGDKFNIKKVRYDKLIIMTDSDVDGSHIRILILTLLYNFMKPLIEEGYVYAAVPPLYRIELKDRTYEYIKDDLDLQEVKKKYGNKIIGVTRFKGLGEMNYEQLRETVLDPRNRILNKITLKECEEASEELVKIAMGKDAQKRREYIEQNADLANLLNL